MKRIGSTGACLLAALAVSAIAAGGAWAGAPEFGKCVAKAGGKFENSVCTKAAAAGKEKFEWEPIAKPVPLHSKMTSTLATLETVKGTKITCTGEEGPAEVANPKEVANLVATFSGCETSKLKCNSAGQAEGVIVTAPLGGVLGVEKLGTTPPLNNKLAVELHGPGGGSLAEFSCAGLPIVVTGSVLHPVVADKMQNSEVEKFAATKGEQKPDHFVAPSGKGETDEHTLMSKAGSGEAEEAGQTITGTVTSEEKVESNTVA